MVYVSLHQKKHHRHNTTRSCSCSCLRVIACIPPSSSIPEGTLRKLERILRGQRPLLGWMRGEIAPSLTKAFPTVMESLVKRSPRVRVRRVTEPVRVPNIRHRMMRLLGDDSSKLGHLLFFQLFCIAFDDEIRV